MKCKKYDISLIMNGSNGCSKQISLFKADICDACLTMSINEGCEQKQGVETAGSGLFQAKRDTKPLVFEQYEGVYGYEE